MDVLIRRATLEDSESVRTLSEELGYPSTAEEMRMKLERVLSRGDAHTILVASIDEHVAGFIHASIVESIETEMFCEIRALVVGAGHRSGGAGARLVAAAEDWGRKNGARTIRVRSNVVRDRAHDFYERLGYSVTKSQRVFDKRLE